MGQLRQSEKYADYISKVGWNVEQIGSANVFVRKLPIIGSVVKIQRPVELRNKELKELRILEKKYRIFQTIIEPARTDHGTLITEHGFRPSRNPYLPSKTIHLNLTQSAEKLYGQLKKDARYSLRKTKNLRVYSVDTIKKFRSAWKSAVGFQRYVPPLKNLNALAETFSNDMQFLVTPGGESGAIFLKAGNTGYYWQAFSSKKGREIHAQYKILWSGIIWARSESAGVFDFEGVYDERFPNKKWLGFSHFKKSFGGREVEYPGPFVKTRLPF